jgi:hypothetical protein
MKTALLALAIVALIGDRASATIVLADNFDSYTQATFETAWTPIGTASSPHTASALISTAQSVSPSQSVSTPANAVPGTAGPYRNRRSFAETTTGIGTPVVFSFDYYDSAPSSSPQRNFANLQDSTAPSATNQLISMGLNNSLASTNDGGNYYMVRLLGYTPTYLPPTSGSNPAAASGSWFKMNATGAPLRSLGWHNLKVVISTDGANAQDYEFYVDNVLSKTILNVGTALRGYDNITIGSGLGNSNTAAFFDNVLLDFNPVAVPEAGSIAAMSMVGLVSAAAVWFRKRRKTA